MVKWTRRFGLRLRLLGVAFVLACIFGVLIAQSAYSTYQASVDNLRNRTQIAARLLAAEHQGIELATQQLLEGLMLATSQDEFAPLLGKDCATTLRQVVLANPVFINVGVFTPSGDVACTADPQAKDLHYGDRPHFVRAAATHSFVVSEPIVSRLAHRVTIVAVQPLIAAGNRLAGMLFASLDLDFFAKSMGRQALPEGTRMLLVNANGTALFRFPDPERRAGQLIREHATFARLVAGNPRGFAELLGFDDVRRMVAYLPLETTATEPLFMWVDIPLTQARAEALANARNTAIRYGILLAAILVVLWLGLERIIIRPVLRLTHAAQRMGRGDLSTRANIVDQGTEIGSLASSLNRLALHVQRTTRALRTLSAGNQTLLHATSESELVQRMCDVSVREGLYMTAAVFMTKGRDPSTHGIEVVAHAGLAPAVRMVPVSPSALVDADQQSTVHAALKSGFPSVVRFTGDAAEDSRREVFWQHGYGSVFSAPLRYEDRIIGTMTLAADDDGAFDDDEAALMTELAADLSFGLTNLRTRSALAASAHRATRARFALSAGSRALAEGLDEVTLLHRICVIAVDHGGYVLAYVTSSTRQEDGTYPVVASHSARTIDATDVAPEGSSTLERRAVDPTMFTGEMTILHGLEHEVLPPRWQRAVVAHPIRAALSLPLREDQRLIGALTILSGNEPSFELEERELLAELAQDISIGITSIRGRSRQEEALAAAKRAATHDAATGLPAQPAMITSLDEALGEAVRTDAPVAVMAIYFPRLESLFHSMGYAVGNSVVNVIAQRLRRITMSDASLGRTRNDEFAMFIANSDAGKSADVVSKLQQSLRETIDVEGAPLDMQAVIGASFFPGQGQDGDLLLRQASLAAHEAARRGTFHLVFTPALKTDNPTRLRLAGELRGAIERRELILHFQPKLSLGTYQVSGSEALVRWQHPVHGLVPPNEFIPIAEQTGQIRELSYLVLELAVRQLAAWSKKKWTSPVAVNLSARDLQNPQLTDRVEGLLATWGVPASLLHFEVTETALLEDPEAARKRLEHLRDLGSQIFIDDFGTGYSSLNYLVTLPVHALKIDRSFIIQMETRPEAATVVASVISMAHGLGLKVVAEGVETVQERDRLVAMGCDEVQGFLIARPMPADTYAAFIEARDIAGDRSASVVGGA